MFYTYVHVQADTGTVFYVGKGQGSRAWHTYNRSPYWKAVAAKHGFRVEILAHWEREEEALDHERLLISCFRDMGFRLANISEGGAPNAGTKHSAEARAKIAERARGRKCSPETREKIAAAKRGKPLSEAAKAARARRPKPPGPSKETQEKIRISSTRLFEEAGVRRTRKEWARHLDLDPSTVYRYVREGRSPSGKVLQP